MKIKRFEDLICWQKARFLNRKIYKLSSLECFNKDYELIKQIRRASISIMLNISEGFGRRTDKEFKYYLFNSHGSVSEVQSCLYIALDCEYINDEIFNELYSDAEEVSKIISGLIKSLNQ